MNEAQVQFVFALLNGEKELSEDSEAKVLSLLTSLIVSSEPSQEHISLAIQCLDHLRPQLSNALYSHQARQGFSLNLRDGTTCPVCDQFCKEYKRKLSSNSARFLISLVKKYEQTLQPVHHTECSYTSRDYPALAWFGLAHTHRSDDGSKRTSGFWEPTPLGIDFVYRRKEICKYLFTYNGKVTSIDPSETVDIKEILGTKFSYQELMTS